MGDTVSVARESDAAVIEQSGLRIVRGLEPDERALVLACWAELWQGAVSSQRELKTLSWDYADDQVRWKIEARTA